MQNEQVCQVIIIDDDTTNRFIMEMLLKRHGNIPVEKIEMVEYASDSLPFILGLSMECTKLRKIVIFLDLYMPVMDGHEYLRALEQYPDELKSLCEVYVMSATLRKSDLDDIKKHSLVKGHFEKPLTTDVIRKIFQ